MSPDLLLSLGLASVACVTTLTLTPLVVRVSLARGWTGNRDCDRHLHRRPIPRLGGVSVFGGIAVGMSTLLLVSALTPLDLEQGRFFRGLLLGSLLLLVLGAVDDLREVRPRTKVVVQLLAALVVFHHGFRIEVLSLGPAGDVSLGLLSLPVTVLWVVGITNAYNLIDGLDGLATGVGMIALAAVMAAAGLLGDHSEVLLVCAVVLGSLGGFLPFNREPARIFLGDSGTLVVGFLLAVLSVHGSVKGATAILATVPLFALALPLLDTSLTIGRRWLRGVPISAADGRHIHHRLLAAGLSRRRAVQILYLSATGFAAVGLFLAFAPGRTGTLALLAGAASALVLLRGLRHLEYEEFTVAGKVLAAGPERARRVIRVRIRAQEVAEVLRVAVRVEEVRAILSDHAGAFQFAHMEICRESQNTRRRWNGSSELLWKLDFPVSGGRGVHDPTVLRIWCPAGDGFRPFGAERVAHALAPVLTDVARRLQAVEALPAPSRWSPSIGRERLASG